MTTQHEIMNAITWGVALVGVVIIVTRVFMFIDRYKIYKFKKYVKEAEEREEAEAAKDKAGRIASRGKW